MYKPQVGDRVFLRSNEPNQPLFIGKVVRMEQIKSCTIPVVLDEKTNKEWQGGCVRPYTWVDEVALTELKAIEQWNYLVRDMPGNQIPVKYGVKYKTFK